MAARIRPVAAQWVTGWAGAGFQDYARIFHPLSAATMTPPPVRHRGQSRPGNQHSFHMGRRARPTSTIRRQLPRRTQGRDLRAVALAPLGHDLSRHTDTPGQCCSPCGTAGMDAFPNPCRTPAEKSALPGLATGPDRRDISRSPDAVTCSTNDPSTKPPPSGWLASLPSVFVGTFTTCQLPPILRTQPSATAVGSEVPFSYERRRCPGRLLTQFYARFGPQRPDVPRQPKRHGSVALS